MNKWPLMRCPIGHLQTFSAGLVHRGHADGWCGRGSWGCGQMRKWNLAHRTRLSIPEKEQRTRVASDEDNGERTL